MEEFGFGFALRFRDAASAGARRLAQSVTGLWRSLVDLKNRGAEAARSNSVLSGAMDSAKSGAARMGSALRQGAARLVQWSTQSANAARATSSLAVAFKHALAFLGVRALFGALTNVVEVGRNFEQQMVNVQSVMGVGQDDLDRLTAKSRQIGRDTAFSATQAAEAMFILGQAGLNTGQVLDTVQHTMNLAAVGGLRMERASEVLIATMGQFGLKTSEAERVVNVFAAASNAAQTDVGRLSLAMAQFGPVARSLGIDLETASAGVAVFSQQGIHGAQAGVALRNITTALVKPSKNLDAALGALGLTMADVNPKTNKFEDILKKIAPLAERTDLVFKLFGQRSGPQFLALVGAGTTAIEDMKRAMSGQLTAAEIYEMRLKTTSGAIALMKSSLEDLKLEIFDVVKPIVLRGVQTFARLWTTVATVVANLRPVLDRLVSDFLELFGMVQAAFGRAVSRLFPSINALRQAGSASASAVRETIAPMILWLAIVGARAKRMLQGILEGASAAWGTFVTLAGPVALVLFKIAGALFKVFGLVGKNGDAWNGFGRTIGYVLGLVALFSLSRWALAIPARVIATWISWGAQAVGTARSVIGAAASAGASIVEWASSSQMLSRVLVSARGAAGALGKGLLALLRNPIVLAAAAVIALVAGLVWLVTHWKQVVAWVGQFNKKIVNLIAVVLMLTFPFTGLIGVIVGGILLLARNWEWFVARFNELFGPAIAYARRLWHQFKVFATRALDALAEQATKAVGWIMAGFRWLIPKALAAVKALVGGAVALLLWLWNSANQFIQDHKKTIDLVVSILIKIWRIFAASVRTSIAMAVVGAKRIFEWFVNTVIPLLKRLWNWIAASVQFVVKVIAGLFLGLVKKVASFFEAILKLWVSVRNFLLKIPFLQPFVKVMDRALKGITNGFRQFIAFLHRLTLPDWLDKMLAWLDGTLGGAATRAENNADSWEKLAFGDSGNVFEGSVESFDLNLSLDGLLGGGKIEKSASFGGAPIVKSSDPVPETGNSIAASMVPDESRQPQQFNFNFNDGALQFRHVIDDPKTLARKLLPALEGVAKERQRKGG